MTDNTKIIKHADENTEFKDWEDINLKTSLLRGIYAYGFEQPSRIQSKAIIPLISRRDVIAQAQSGTGKTGAFTIGALELVDPSVNQPQIIILSPTRELSIQTFEVLSQLSQQMKNLNIQLFIGGTSVDLDLQKLERKTPQIIVGCPGRVYDMFKRKYLSPKSMSLIILDEADEILSSGFKEQVYNILQFMP